MIQQAVPAYQLGGLLKGIQKLIGLLSKARKANPVTSVTKYRGGVPAVVGQREAMFESLNGEKFVTPESIFYEGTEFGSQHDYDISYAARDDGDYNLRYSPLIIINEDIGGSRASFQRKVDIAKKVYDEASRYFSSDTRKMAIEKNKVRAQSIYGKDYPFLKQAEFDAVNQLAYPTRIAFMYNMPDVELPLEGDEYIAGEVKPAANVGDYNMVYINSKVPDNKLEENLWHELMHVGFLSERPGGVGKLDNAVDVGEKIHEKLVNVATDAFYKRLVDEILVSQYQALKQGLPQGRIDYIYNPKETAAYAMEIGQRLGLKPGEKYIDDKSTIDLINKAKWAYGHDPHEVHVQLLNLIKDTPEARKNWFEAMTGQLFTIGALIGASKLVNYINNDGGK